MQDCKHVCATHHAQHSNPSRALMLIKQGNKPSSITSPRQAPAYLPVTCNHVIHNIHHTCALLVSYMHGKGAALLATSIQVLSACRASSRGMVALYTCTRNRRMASDLCSHCDTCHIGAEIKDEHSRGRHKMRGTASSHALASSSEITTLQLSASQVTYFMDCILSAASKTSLGLHQLR